MFCLGLLLLPLAALKAAAGNEQRATTAGLLGLGLLLLTARKVAPCRPAKCKSCEACH